MNKLDKQYQDLLQDIIDNGVIKKDRTGTGTKSVFGRMIRHKMSDGFPLLTTKKMAWDSVVTELIWFLKGDTNIQYLVKNGCNIWNGDAYKNYKTRMENNLSHPLYINKWLKDNGDGTHSIYSMEEFVNKIKLASIDDEFVKQWGDLGPIYGKQWKSWKVFNSFKHEIDQIAEAVNALKTNPDSRRTIVSAWNVGEIDQMVLPPCHFEFQFYTRDTTIADLLPLSQELRDVAEKKKEAVLNQTYQIAADLRDKEKEIIETLPKKALSLMWNQRSVDTFLGLPFNIASYGLLLEIIAREVGMIPDELIGVLGDTHLYLNHITQAKEQIIREPFELPKMGIEESLQTAGSWILDEVNGVILKPKDFMVLGYQCHPTIKAPLSN